MAGIVQSQRRKRLSRALYALSLALLLFSLTSLAWAVWPVPTDARTFTIPAGPLPGAPSGTSFASQVDYTLQVSWPRWIRAGEAGQIVVSLSEAEASVDETQARETQIVLLSPSVTGLPLDPAGQTQINLGPGQELTQAWSVDGLAAGDHAGKLVAAFGFFDDALGQLVPVPVAVVDLSIQVVTLWGLARGLVLWLGVVGLALWGALFILGRVVEGGGRI
jgi:hypothetical protein